MKKILLLIIFLIIISSFFIIHQVNAGTSDNVSGYAWSENIGWISFNCTDGGTCATVDYGVNIDSGTGNFSGYAWSENIGWIDFAPAGPYPTDPQYSAKADLGTGQVSGWARALAYDAGWDGWIKMRCYGTECDTSDYGVYIDGAEEFHDYAWEPDVIGWISFNCLNTGVCATSDYKVITTLPFNQAPSAINLSVTQDDYCGYTSPAVFLSWEFSDPDVGDTQTAYQVQVDDNSDFSSIEKDSGKVISSSNQYSPTGLSYDSAYYWRVKVWDSEDAESIWAEGPFFSTGSQLPYVDFTWSPSEPAAEEIIQFTDLTLFYGTPGTESWAWDFDEDSITDSTEQNPTWTYSSSGDHIVVLTAADDKGTCSVSKTLTATAPLPEWKEVPPFGWIPLKNLFARIFSQ
jgi:hypothetical protein